MILDSREKIEFYRSKMQELVSGFCLQFSCFCTFINSTALVDFVLLKKLKKKSVFFCELFPNLCNKKLDLPKQWQVFLLGVWTSFLLCLTFCLFAFRSFIKAGVTID